MVYPNRTIAERAAVEKSFYLDYLYKEVYAPEEHYYITLVNELGSKIWLIILILTEQATTFVN